MAVAGAHHSSLTRLNRWRPGAVVKQTRRYRFPHGTAWIGAVIAMVVVVWLALVFGMTRIRANSHRR